VTIRARARSSQKAIFGWLRRSSDLMIALGVFLLIIAVLVPKLAVLWAVGVIVLVVGLALAVLGTMGRAVGGRRHYY
jgi:membrane-bound ClpP family serine protease